MAPQSIAGSHTRAGRPNRRLAPLGFALAAAALAATALAPATSVASPAGTLDPNWGGTGTSTCSSNQVGAFCARAILVLPNGKILMGGAAKAWNGGSGSLFRLFRLNADGTVDSTFPVVETDSYILALGVNAQGEIFVGGESITSVKINGGTPTPRKNMFVLNADGTLKTSFNPNTTFQATDRISALTPTTDGGVIIGGQSVLGCSEGWCNLARLDATGALDSSFTAASESASANREVLAIVPAPGGGYYVGGVFTEYKGQTAKYIARIKEDGSRDTTFAGAGANGFVWSLAPQGTQGVLIGGSFTTYDGQAARGLARAKTDGTIDTTFSAGANWGATVGGSAATVFTVGLDPAGRILVGGNFDSFGLRDGGGTVTPSTVGGFVGLNADGTSDSAFNTAVGSAANASGPGCDTVTQYESCRVGALAATPDSIFVGGTFSTFAGTNKNGMVRLANDAKAVTVTTSGNGSVTSEPAGLDCGSVCTTYVREGGTVTLTATPAAGQTFLGWGGACSGTALTCTLTLSSDQTVEARFSSGSSGSGGSGGSGASGTGSGGGTPPVATAGRARVSPTGVVSVLVTTTGAGLVRIAGTRTRKAIACTARRTFGAAGSATMYCVPTRATRAKLRRGPVRVSLALVFTPTGGATTSTRLGAVTMPRIGSRMPAVTG